MKASVGWTSRSVAILATMNETASSPSNLAPLISLVVVLIITISGSALSMVLLVVIIRSTSLHTLDTSFVAHLAVVDFFLGIDATGHAIFLNFSFEDKNYERRLCLGLHTVAMYIFSAQITALWWLTFDRFLKVCYPFTHDRFCTKNKNYSCQHIYAFNCNYYNSYYHSKF